MIYLNKNSDEILVINWESFNYVHIVAKDVHGVVLIEDWKAIKNNYELIGKL